MATTTTTTAMFPEPATDMALRSRSLKGSIPSPHSQREPFLRFQFVPPLYFSCRCMVELPSFRALPIDRHFNLCMMGLERCDSNAPREQAMRLKVVN